MHGFCNLLKVAYNNFIGRDGFIILLMEENIISNNMSLLIIFEQE